jgi:hypothetical protein
MFEPIAKTVDLQAVDVGSAHRCLFFHQSRFRVLTWIENLTSEIPRRWRARKMTFHISDPLSWDTTGQDPKRRFSTTGTDCASVLVSRAGSTFRRTYWNGMSEDKRHSLQLRESIRLRNDPWDQSRFDVLLDSHKAKVRSRFWKCTDDGVMKLRHCTSLVRAP